MGFALALWADIAKKGLSKATVVEPDEEGATPTNDDAATDVAAKATTVDRQRAERAFADMCDKAIVSVNDEPAMIREVRVCPSH